MTFILAFISMYFLVIYLTKDEIAALVSGICYAFCHYHFAHSIHPSLYNIHWLPLFIISLFLLNRYRDTLTIIVSSLLFAIVTYSDAYYGYFAGVIALVFVIYKRLPIKIVIKFGILSLLLILPFVLWSRSLWMPRTGLIFSYPAYWTDYIYPFGYESIEHVLYIGAIPILLALIGLKSADKFFVVLFIVALVLSLNEPLIPIFRATARFGLIVMLAISVLAGYGIKSLE